MIINNCIENRWHICFLSRGGTKAEFLQNWRSETRHEGQANTKKSLTLSWPTQMCKMKISIGASILDVWKWRLLSLSYSRNACQDTSTVLGLQLDQTIIYFLVILPWQRNFILYLCGRNSPALFEMSKNTNMFFFHISKLSKIPSSYYTYPCISNSNSTTQPNQHTRLRITHDEEWCISSFCTPSEEIITSNYEMDILQLSNRIGGRGKHSLTPKSNSLDLDEDFVYHKLRHAVQLFFRSVTVILSYTFSS